MSVVYKEVERGIRMASLGSGSWTGLEDIERRSKENVNDMNKRRRK